MRPLACVVILAAFALPCRASDPAKARMEKRPPTPAPGRIFVPMGVPNGLVGLVNFVPNLAVGRINFVPLPAKRKPILSGETIRAVLFPDRALIRWGADRLGWGRLTGNTIGLQIPRVPAANLNIPIRVTMPARGIAPLGGE